MFQLAKFSGSIWKIGHPRFAVSPAFTFDLFEKSLRVFSYHNQPAIFCVVFRVYGDYLLKFKHEEDRTTRLNDLLTLAVSGGFESDVILIDEELCGLAAVRATTPMMWELDKLNLDWASLYFNQAETSALQSPKVRFKLRQERGSLLTRQGRFKGYETLLRNLSEIEQLSEKDVVDYGITKSVLGWNRLAQGDKFQAVKYFTEALVNLEKHPNVERSILYCLFRLGDVNLSKKNKPDVARSYFKKALTRARKEVWKRQRTVQPCSVQDGLFGRSSWKCRKGSGITSNGLAAIPGCILCEG